jgi:chaperonin GroEL
MHIKRGFVSSYFVTNKDTMVCEMDDPFVLLTSKKITNIQQILKILEGAAKISRPLLIIADDIEGEALTTLIINRIRGVIKVCAIKCPGFGDHRLELLKDIAVFTDSQVLCDENGDRIEDIEVNSSEVGSARKVIVGKDYTSIIDGAGDHVECMARIELIKQQISEASSEYDREELRERVDQLLGNKGDRNA